MKEDQSIVQVYKPVRDDTAVALRVAGLLRCSGAWWELELFLGVLRWCVAKEKGFRPASATASEELRLTSEQMAAEWARTSHELSQLDLRKVHAIVSVEMLFASLSGRPESWELGLNRSHIRRFRGVNSIGEYLKVVAERERAYQGATTTALGTQFELSQLVGSNSREEEPTLRLSNLHPVVREACQALFESGHWQQGVSAAVIALRDLVRRESGLLNLDGDGLMGKAFSVNEPRIVVADLETESGKNIQQGAMLLALGIIARVRNPLAHEQIQLVGRDCEQVIAEVLPATVGGLDAVAGGSLADAVERVRQLDPQEVDDPELWVLVEYAAAVDPEDPRAVSRSATKPA